LSRNLRLTEEQYRKLAKPQPQAQPKANKYKAQRVGDADSKKEDRRLGELRLLAHAGEIGDLRHHVSYSLHVNGIHVCDYEADFVYREKGVEVVEDAKGYRTPVYKLKKRLMRAVLGIEIRES